MAKKLKRTKTKRGAKKMPEHLMERRRDLTIRLVREVGQYFRVFGAPMPQKIAAGKYNRAMSAVGGFPQIVDELVMEGSIKKFINDKGSSYLAPTAFRAKEWNGAVLCP